MTSKRLPPVIGYRFDDLEIGHTFETDRVTFTESAIIDYALQWDPQPFHIDRRAAERSLFTGLVASGLHTLNLSYRLFCDSGFLRGNVVAGLGLEAVRFPRPVTPGMTVHVRVTVSEKAATKSPERGRLKLLLQTVSDRDEVVLETGLNVLVSLRESGSG